MKRRISVAFLGLVPLGLLFIGFNVLRLQAAPLATTIVVNTLVDEKDGSCMDGDCSLRDAIATAAANDLIVFDNGLSGGLIDIASMGHMTITKNLTISGTVPITISGSNQTRIFAISGGPQVNIYSLTLANGQPAVADCVVLGAPFPCGGAVRVINSEVMVNDVSFVNNSAESGAAMWIYYSQLNVIGSSFMNNTAEYGGGIKVVGNSNTIVIDSVFVDNSVTQSGGAISNGDAEFLHVQDSLFDNNSAQFGGAISGAAFAEIIVENSTLTNNTADYGGAIMVGISDSILTVRKSTLSGNIANRAGGAIYSQVDNTMTIENSTITGNMVVGNNSGTDGGGGIIMTWRNAINSITNSTIVSNTAPNVSGRDGIWILSGTLQIRNSIVAFNGSENCTVDGGTFNGNSSNIADDSTCSGFSVGDPLIESLANNGGNTLTHALLPGSPAIDGGNNGVCPLTDQRGTPRPADGNGDMSYVCDVGAFEFINYSEYSFLPAFFRP